MTEKWHRHIGVYGICSSGNRLLVVNKTRGPYKNRYDLPGGSMEYNETIEDTLLREFREETGLQIIAYKHLGFSEYIVRYSLNEHSHIQHIPLFFLVVCKDSQEDNKELPYSDDTEGCEWVRLQDIHQSNASPLVMKAMELIARKQFSYESKRFDEWVTIRNHERSKQT